MKTKVQPTPINTEQPAIEHENLDKDYYWNCYNVCKLGQEMPVQLVQIMADSATQAFDNWLRSINPPEEVLELYHNAQMLSIYEGQLSAGGSLSPRMGADLLDTIVSAGKSMRAVGATFCPEIIPNDLPGTLPRYTLQAIDPEKFSE